MRKQAFLQTLILQYDTGPNMLTDGEAAFFCFACSLRATGLTDGTQIRACRCSNSERLYDVEHRKQAL
ncbi:MAG TPA: hypothetical protein EYQ01_03400 [Nitrospira sp.]|nr:hypothetical protein [Candidatus Manganitrophaceae bacterium]